MNPCTSTSLLTALALSGCMHFDTLLADQTRNLPGRLARRGHLSGADRPLPRRQRRQQLPARPREHGPLPRRRLAGPRGELDYIEELGVTTLWISPVIKNIETDANVDGYHGYWAVDLTQPNAHFGNLDDLRKLVQGAHDRDMLVVIDIVTNHMGQLFYYDMNLNGAPDILLQGTGTRPQGTAVPPGFDQSGFASPSTTPTSTPPASRPSPRWAPRVSPVIFPWQPEDRAHHADARAVRPARDLQPQGPHV